MQIFVRNFQRGEEQKVHYKKHILPLSLLIDAAMCETTEKIDTKLGIAATCWQARILNQPRREKNVKMHFS